jgi:hypothetical protein
MLPPLIDAYLADPGYLGHRHPELIVVTLPGPAPRPELVPPRLSVQQPGLEDLQATRGEEHHRPTRVANDDRAQPALGLFAGVVPLLMPELIAEADALDRLAAGDSSRSRSGYFPSQLRPSPDHGCSVIRSSFSPQCPQANLSVSGSNFEKTQLAGAPLRNRTVDLLLTMDSWQVFVVHLCSSPIAAAWCYVSACACECLPKPG